MRKNTSLPKFIIVVTRDWGSFLAVFGPPIMASCTFLVYLSEIVSGKAIDRSIYDVLSFFALIPISSLLFLPAVLWWFYVIRRTFKKGGEVNADIKKVDKKFMLNIGVTYTFNMDGKEYEHISDFRNINNIRKILTNSQHTIAFDPKRNISFLKEVFLER